MEGRVILLTGFPGFIGSRLLEALGREGKIATAFLLVQERFLDLARARLSEVIAAVPSLEGRCTLQAGDITRPALGLAEADLAAVRESVQVVYHLAAVYDLTMSREIGQRVNVDGTRNVLDLCESLAAFERLIYFSTCYVVGRRTGRILEDELVDAGFKNHYEESKFLAEAEVRRRMDRLPTVILRPAIVAGDSRTGKTDKLDGPYFLLRALHRAVPMIGRVPRFCHLLPGRGQAEMNIVPVDYVVRAAAAVLDLPEALGKTLHLCDPNPWTGREFYLAASRRLGYPDPVAHLPYRLYKQLLHIRALRRWLGVPVELVDYFNYNAIFDETNARTILGPRGIFAPPIATYFNQMVQAAADPALPGGGAKF